MESTPPVLASTETDSESLAYFEREQRKQAGILRLLLTGGVNINLAQAHHGSEILGVTSDMVSETMSLEDAR